LAKAKVEIENYRDYGYILVNDILDRAVEEMAAIVAAERMIRSPGSVTPQDEELLKMAERCRQQNSGARIQPVLQAFGVVNSETTGR
jgi:guanylate kinase